MIYLESNQLNFLKSLYKTEKMDFNSIPKSKMKIVKFLKDNELIEYEREITRQYLDAHTRTFRTEYGSIISISISENGKAYLSERKYNLKSLLLKDVFIPIIVTLFTNLLIFGIQWLLPLIQGLLTHTPK